MTGKASRLPARVRIARGEGGHCEGAPWLPGHTQWRAGTAPRGSGLERSTLPLGTVVAVWWVEVGGVAFSRGALGPLAPAPPLPPPMGLWGFQVGPWTPPLVAPKDHFCT